MAVLTYTDEYTSPIPPARAFKASILDADNLIPKLMPEAFKSIEVLQGDGSAGTIKQINFAEGWAAKTIIKFWLSWRLMLMFIHSDIECLVSIYMQVVHSSV